MQKPSKTIATDLEWTIVHILRLLLLLPTSPSDKRLLSLILPCITIISPQIIMPLPTIMKKTMGIIIPYSKSLLHTPSLQNHWNLCRSHHLSWEKDSLLEILLWSIVIVLRLLVEVTPFLIIHTLLIIDTCTLIINTCILTNIHIIISDP